MKNNRGLTIQERIQNACAAMKLQQSLGTGRQSPPPLARSRPTDAGRKKGGGSLAPSSSRGGADQSGRIGSACPDLTDACPNTECSPAIPLFSATAPPLPLMPGQLAGGVSLQGRCSWGWGGKMPTMAMIRTICPGPIAQCRRSMEPCPRTRPWGVPGHRSGKQGSRIGGSARGGF